MASYSVVPPQWGDSNLMFSLSQQLVAQAEAYIQQIRSINIIPPTITPIFPVLSAAPAPVTAPLPALKDVVWTVPNQPNPFNGSLAVQLPGPFDGTPPVLNFGTPPAPFSKTEPAPPGIDLNFIYPDVKVTFPTPPTLLSLDVVQFPNVTVPDFAATVPTLQARAPNIIRFIEPAIFTSSLLTQLETDLQNALSEGTFTGLPAAIETNLWNRAREREYRQMADAILELDRMESMGFAFPPGVFLDSRLKIQTEMQNTTAGLSREIAIKQAELMLENIVKARENATMLEGKLIDYSNQVAQRAFETSRYATEASISIYNAEVQAYTAALEGFKTEAIVYETQIKGLLARVDVAKAQIDFERAKAEINTALVEQYKGEVQAAEAVLEIYKTQVAIIELRANVEKIKIDVFSEQIKAFVAQVNAYTAQVEGYKVSVEAQGVIESAYKTSVDAYAATVEAGVAEANVLVAQYRGQIEAYTAQLEAYKASVQSMVGQAQAASLFNTAEAEVYKAEAIALGAYNDTLTKQWEAVINEQEKIAEVGIQAAKANGDLYIAARGLSLDASKVGAQVSAQLGAAALGAIHWANNSSWSTAGSSATNDQNTTSHSDATIDESIQSS